MPVSTRSHTGATDPRTTLRNPHHGLKEKMRELTLLYEQHKKAAPKSHIPISRRSLVKLQNQDEAQDDLMKENALTNIPSARKVQVKNQDERVLILRENSIARKYQVEDQAKQALVLIEKSNVANNSNAKRRISFLKNEEKENVLGPTARKLSMGGAGSRIMVYVRLRPMARKEKEAGARSCIKVVNKKDVYLTEFASENDFLRLNRVRGRHFCFDASFGEATTQSEVYSITTGDLVEGVLEGRNGSVFCYGATGAGKTYTMLGTVENPGVMVLAIKDLFAKIRQRSYDGNHCVHLSYLEVYNETVRDLLSPGRPLVLREDKQGITAAGLTLYRAYSTDEVMALLQQGNMNRTTEPTRVNETSSRSHAILQVIAEHRVNSPTGISTRIGKLSLIDLAGSERALATDQRTLRSIEGANINRSLLALSSCINALVEGKKHVPYRNSKLTQLLKDSLGGQCNTVMIANISPSNLSFGETQNTLHWADRAKEIRTKACAVNEEPVAALPESEACQAKLVLELQKENSELRQQLILHQKKLLTVQTAARDAGVKAMEAEIERLKRAHAMEIRQKDEIIRELKGAPRTGTRMGTRKAEADGELKSPVHRFVSPVQTAAAKKKRSVWDISGSPAVGTGTGRRTRSYVAPATPPPVGTSMLLQPGFARRRTGVL